MVKIYFLDKDQRQQIGYDFVMDKIEVLTPFGTDIKKNLKPFKKNEKELLLIELRNINKIVQNFSDYKHTYRGIERLLLKVKDIRNSIKRCDNLTTLDDVELFEIKNFSMIIEELYEIYYQANESLNIECIDFFSLKGVIKILDPEENNIPTFYIYDSYSEKLKNIREQKRKLEDKILFSEDEDLVLKLKEERLKYVMLEDEEELIIRRKLTEQINAYVNALNKNIESIGKLDFLIAKSKLAINYEATMPEICDSMDICIKNAVNPEVDHILELRGKSFTPINIRLKSGVSLITGANMGGKSVTLKTLVLNLLLGQMGFFVFCEYASFPIVDFIYFISDDLQSVSQGLSTFGAEIIKLKHVIEHAKLNTGFIALDEFARGTNPKEGAFLVKSLCNYLNSLDSISLVSTHYDNVVSENMVHYQVMGLKNVDFQSLKRKIDLNRTHSVEIIQEHMDYRLEIVSTKDEVPKDALNICILLGLQEDIINIAKENYFNENIF